MLPLVAGAAEHHGLVTFDGFGVPGATVRLTQGAKAVSAVSDQGGLYSFDDLAEGVWKIDIEMQCFSTVEAEVIVSAKTPPGSWELNLLPLDQIMQRSKLTTIPLAAPPPPTGSAGTAAAVKKPAASGAEAGSPDAPKPDAASEAADGFLVNGSSNNAATSKFSIDQAFGNQRSGSKGLYNGGLAAIVDNSALDARPYSLSGLNAPKASYNRITGVFTFGGPIRIPRLVRRGPNFFIGYQWTRDRVAETESGLVPTVAERGGDLSGVRDSLGQPVTIFNPATGLPFVGNIVPVSAQAAALLQLYPLPNITAANALYNYQRPVLNSTHQDALQLRMDKSVGRKDELFGAFNLKSTRAGNANLFGFNDTTDTFGLNTSVNWSHRFSQHLFLNSGFKFSRLRTQVVPFFENRTNVSGAAGITGNDQQPANWGPPTLEFSGAIEGLSDGHSSFNRNRTDGVSGSVALYPGRHNITVGGDSRKQEFNDFFQQDARGSFVFTGAATAVPGGTAGVGTGSDLADFLIGAPDTSSIAFGNADKYFRQPVYDAYATDDWRVLSTLTINAGVRWEYGAPMTELHGRLVNLDVAPGFTSVAPVLGSAPVGPLTGRHYSNALVHADRLGFEPRVGVSWRPVPASTLVIRAGYGVYHDTSVYLNSALALAQQAPLSKSLNVQNSAACPLTLADGFVPCSSITADSFGIDPDFRVGYAQTGQVAVQRDLPGSLQLVATYLGVKGSHGVQQFLPNTYPIGAVNRCPACPAGFVYQTSGGASMGESGQVQVRRRLKDGFTASLLYTYSKSVDDDAYLGGQGHVESSGTQGGAADLVPTTSTTANAAIAQNWLDLRGERSLSSFDQRHLLKLQAQYTSGEGLGGGTLMSGWRGRLLKEWTVVTAVGAGTGLPETPIYLAAVPGTGFTGAIRPDRTGAPVYLSQTASGVALHLNAAAYAAPVAGQWGTAGRNSITGPGQFTLDTSMARTFRPGGKYFLDLQVDAANLLNHVDFSAWNTVINGARFGLPVAANSMRSVQTTLRLRF